MTSPQDAFLYDRLPSETSIRLIALEHLLCEDIHLSLQTFELEEAPTYDALSYTWGDPRCAYLHLDSPETSIGYTQDCYEVRCNGSKFMVRRNLKDALDMLQWWYSTSPAKQNFVWIDAICIDQTSILERESQVSLMDRIYRKASTVIAWIGQEDASTPDALTVIERISSVPIISGSVDSASASDLIEYAKMFTTQDMLSPSAHISKLGIEPLSLKHWLGLIGFLHRPYFKRVWVVQEVTLANKLLAICGRRSFEWTALSKTLLFIALTNWVTQLHTEYLRVYSQSDPGIYHRLLQLNLEPGYGAYYLTQTRRETRNFNRLFRFATLLKSHRHCDASDPRDKIFALIGISRTPPFTTTGNPLRADYSISFEALYTKVTRMLPCSEGNLDFLSWREVVNKQRHTSKLPSWVPDYRNALIPDSLNERSKTCNWNAHGHLCWKPGIQDWSDPLLPVQGFCVGSITSVTEQEPGVRPVSWREIYQVSRGLEPLYLARRFDQNISSEQVDEQAQTRLEVICRTLIADTFLGDHPAPPKALTQFLLCLKMQALILPKPKSAFGFLKNKLRYKLSRFGTMKTFEAENGAWSKILNTEPDSAAFELDRLEAVLDEMAEELRQAAEQDRRQIQRKWYHNYEIERNLTCGTRQLFRTEEALLGVGPINTQVGDQVWILAGMSTPAVLRTALSGNYIFLGEAYVHGIMHGEVADGFPEETLDDILLE